MLTVVVPTLNAEKRFVDACEPLVAAAADGVVVQVVVSDGGSTDHTMQIADDLGCDWVRSERGRGQQLAAGAEKARGRWLMFLHADTVLQDGWHHEAKAFMEAMDRREETSAAVFRFRLDDFGWKPRFIEKMVGLRCLMLGLPYGDQGLLISRRHYEEIGGFKPMPLMEDVDLIRRIRRRRLVHLQSQATTSAERYQRNGYMWRSLRNLGCLSLYYLGVPSGVISRIYR